MAAHCNERAGLIQSTGIQRPDAANPCPVTLKSPTCWHGKSAVPWQSRSHEAAVFGIHGDDRVRVYAELCEVAEDVLRHFEFTGKPLPSRRPLPMMKMWSMTAASISVAEADAMLRVRMRSPNFPLAHAPIR